MKLNKKYSFLLGLVILWVTSVCASPTIYGPTGLISIPTADSLKYKEFNLGYDHYQNSENEDIQGGFYKLNIGIFENWEVGFVGGKTPTEGVYINTKYYLMSDKSRFPLSIAIGIDNIAAKKNTGVYMVASKHFKGGVVGHFGFKTVFHEETGLDPSIMGGVEYFLSDQFSLLADINGEQKSYILNAGLRFEIIKNVHIRGFVMDLSNNRKMNLYSFGVSFSKFI